MAKKIYYRLVVPITRTEFVAISKEAYALGFKNVHRWGAHKMAEALRKVTGQQK